jgi:hypothetical protein
MTIQEAINKAIEGGWLPHSFFTGKWDYDKIERVLNYWIADIQTARQRWVEAIFLDPRFWECLFGDKRLGRAEAKAFIGSLFDSKTAEQFFSNLK